MVGLESLQGLPDGGASHPEFGGQCYVVDRLSRSDVEQDELVLEAVVSLGGQRDRRGYLPVQVLRSWIVMVAFLRSPPVDILPSQEAYSSSAIDILVTY